MVVECEPGAVWFIQQYFHDCVYNIKDGSGFALGTASIFLWITAQLPQFIDNMRNQSADGLSVWFLAQWFLGDTLNLLGCLMTGEQLPSTTAIAMYFVVSDVFMLTQFVYYGALQRRRQLLEEKVRRHSMRRMSLAHQQQQQRSHAMSQVHQPHQHHHHQHKQQRRRTEPPTLDTSYLSPHTLAPFSPGGGYSGPQGLPSALVMLPGGPQAPSQPAEQAQQAAQQAQQAALGPAVTYGFRADGSNQAGSRMAATIGTAAGAASLLCFAAVTAGQGWQPHQPPGLAQGTAQPWLAGSTPGMGGHHGKGGDDDLPWWQDVDVLLRVLGTVCGYCSTLLYLGSRLSQIYKNWSRKSAEGLSVVMFMFTIGANLCTGCSILLRLKDMQAFQAQLPWLCGAFGTVGLDMFIFKQALLYNKAGKEGGEQGLGHHATVLVAGSSAGRPSLACKSSSAVTNPLHQPLLPA